MLSVHASTEKSVRPFSNTSSRTTRINSEWNKVTYVFDDPELEAAYQEHRRTRALRKVPYALLAAAFVVLVNVVLGYFQRRDVKVVVLYFLLFCLPTFVLAGVLQYGPENVRIRWEVLLVFDCYLFSLTHTHAVSPGGFFNGINLALMIGANMLYWLLYDISSMHCTHTGMFYQLYYFTWAFIDTLRNKQAAFARIVDVIVVTSLFWLARVGQHSFEKVGRENFVHVRKLNLEKAALEKRMELQEQKKDAKLKELDLDDSPAQFMIRMLRDLRTNPRLTPDNLAAIDVMVENLSHGSADLFSADVVGQIETGNVINDRNTADWLLKNFELKRGTTKKNHSLRKFSSDRSNLKSSLGTPSLAPSPRGLLAPHLQIDPSLLGDVDKWHFDVFALVEALPNTIGPLQVVASYLFDAYNFEMLGINRDNFLRYVKQVEKMYHNQNPFHNAIHAADVVQTAHFWLQSGVFDCFSLANKFSLLFAAVVHDVDHGGVNNNFEVNTSSAKALLYNDRAVLENHHLATAFTMMSKYPDVDPFVDLSEVERQSFRGEIINVVFATDMAAHFDLVGKFKGRLGSDSWDPMEEGTDRMLLMKMLLKCSDISNPAKPLVLYERWTQRVMEEFFQQGESERARGMTVSAMMDRDSTNVAQCQLGFIDYIVAPMYTVWTQYLEIPEVMESLTNNRDTWASRTPQESPKKR